MHWLKQAFGLVKDTHLRWWYVLFDSLGYVNEIKTFRPARYSTDSAIRKIKMNERLLPPVPFTVPWYHSQF